MAGDSLQRVRAAREYVTEETPFDAPHVGEPATLLAITAACLSTVLNLLVAGIRLAEMKLHLPQMLSTAIDYIVSE